MRMNSISFIEYLQNAGLLICDFQRIKPDFSRHTSLFSGGFYVQQRRFERGCPPESLLFRQERQIAHQMGIAGGMLIAILGVRTPSVKDLHANAAGQDPNNIQLLISSARMHLIMGERRSTGSMHPGTLAYDLQARFILVDNVCLHQDGFQAPFHRIQILGAAFDPRAEDNIHTHHDSQQVFYHFMCPHQQQNLLLHEIHGDGSNPRSVSNWGKDSLGKGNSTFVIAARALFLFNQDLMKAGQIYYLATLNARAKLCLHIFLATTRWMKHHLIRDGRTKAFSGCVGFLLGFFALLE